MDIKKLLQNNLINAVQEPGMSFNSRQFGPYKLNTQVQAYPGYSGSKIVHSVDLPENEQPNREMALEIAKQLQINPDHIYDINPGSSWISGNTNINTPNLDNTDRFLKLKNQLKK